MGHGGWPGADFLQDVQVTGSIRKTRRRGDRQLAVDAPRSIVQLRDKSGEAGKAVEWPTEDAIAHSVGFSASRMEFKLSRAQVPWEIWMPKPESDPNSKEGENDER